jgi:hypothetical protein
VSKFATNLEAHEIRKFDAKTELAFPKSLYAADLDLLDSALSLKINNEMITNDVILKKTCIMNNFNTCSEGNDLIINLL